MIDSKKVLIAVKEYLFITVGILLYVLGWSIFLVPNNLIGGGVTGIASIVQYATGGLIKMGHTYFTLNIGLLILALFTLGKNFGGKTVYAIVLASVGLNVFQSIIPADFIKIMALDNGKLMSTLMGAIMVGVGIGTTISNGGSTGGTDIIALVVNKYRNVSPGRMILIVDAVIIMSSLFVPSYTKEGVLLPFSEKVTVVVYGFILITVMTTVIDMCVAGSKQSVQLFILSKKYAEIADEITKNFHRGVTVLNGQGWYTKQESHVLMILTRKRDLTPLLKYVKTADSEAFISISSVTGVYGKGFETFKTGSKNNSQK